MKNRIKILLSLLLPIVCLSLSYLCTYWYDAVDQDGREFFAIMTGFIFAGLGFVIPFIIFRQD